MKTKLILSSLLVVFSMQAFAQDVTIIQSNATDNTQSYSSKKTHKPRFWIGPKFGTDIINGIPSDMASVSARLKEQWQAGVMMQFGRTLYLQPEVYYASTTTDPGLESSVDNQEIRIPVMLGLRFLNLGLFSLHIMGGPSWTLPMNNESQVDVSSKKMEILVGAGIDVLGFITADIRYAYRDGVALNQQIKDLNVSDPDPARPYTPLNVTIGLKLR